MLTIEKYAAIDIGSNAIRLLVANVIEQDANPTLFRKNELIRSIEPGYTPNLFPEQ